MYFKLYIGCICYASKFIPFLFSEWDLKYFKAFLAHKWYSNFHGLIYLLTIAIMNFYSGAIIKIFPNTCACIYMYLWELKRKQDFSSSWCLPSLARLSCPPCGIIEFLICTWVDIAKIFRVWFHCLKQDIYSRNCASISVAKQS